MQRFKTACDGFLLFLELMKYFRYWFSDIPSKKAHFVTDNLCFCWNWKIICNGVKTAWLAALGDIMVNAPKHLGDSLGVL